MLTRDEFDVMAEVHLRVEQDDVPVRGNAIASGDDELDREVEDEILARLESGDVWAWAQVEVYGTLDLEEFGEIRGESDYLGCGSYKDEADFRAVGYFQDMKDVALDNLWAKYRAILALGEK